MLWQLTLASLVLGHPTGPVRRFAAGPLSFELPASFRPGNQQGSYRFETSDGAGYVLVDINKVENPSLTPEECLDRVLSQMRSGPRWHRLSAGGMPVANRGYTDFSANGAEVIRSNLWAGCDGRYAWAVTIQFEISYYEYFANIGDHLVESMRMNSAPPP